MRQILLLFLLFLVCTACDGQDAVPESLTHPFAPRTVVDLTHVMQEDMPVWPGGVPFKKERLADYDAGYRLHRFEMGENTGTHVDAPAHFIRRGRTIDAIPLHELVVPAVVIDVRERVGDNPDYQLTPGDIEAWEAANGQIPAGALVILNTGWHVRFAKPARYVNVDEDGVMHFPGYHPESAALLIARAVVGVGIDTLSIDHGAAQELAFHEEVLKAGKYQIENLGNLDALPSVGATIVVGVLPVKDGTQAQARILALLP